MTALHITATNQPCTARVAAASLIGAWNQLFPGVIATPGNLGEFSHTGVVSTPDAEILASVVVQGDASDLGTISLRLEVVRDEGWKHAAYAALFGKHFFGAHGTAEWRTQAYGWQDVITVNYTELFNRNLVPDTFEAFNEVRKWRLL